MTSRFLVYTHTRPDTGAVFYVGKGTVQRPGRKTNRNLHWFRIVKKAGGFSPQIIRAEMEEAEALRFERELIADLRSQGVELCNMTDGGEGVSGHRHSVDTRRRLSEAHKGQVPWNKGHKTPPEVIAKMRVAKIGWKPSASMIASVRAALTGVPKTEQARRNMSAAQMGKRHSIETRAKTGRAVVCITTGETFLTMNLAAEKLGVHCSSITRVCKGQLKTTGKMKFRYAGAEN